MKEQPHAKQPSPKTPAARILIVDDDTDILDVFPHLFRPGQYAITMASRGSLALDLASHHTFDLAFVDYFMDDMNGVVVAQRLRHAQPHIQIVLMSGYTFDDKTEIMASSGARAFLHKPLKADYIQALTDRLLTASAPAAPAASSGVSTDSPPPAG
ncbi:MAG: response regulator [Verrucomicrobia bacterium]|nr:response regulator [Verrucomicrobiota bacterium]